jgi:hypothetical protein
MTTNETAETAAFDLYRDIHKGIRSTLFTTTSVAGSTDPSDSAARAALAVRVDAMVDLLVSHARHEDDHMQPSIEEHLPELAARVAVEHARIERQMATLREITTEAIHTPPDRARLQLHRIYLELSSFTSAYLLHQDLEERAVMPALERAVGFDALLGMHEAIVSSIPPDEMARTLTLMLPAMNVDDRTELLGGMRASAPAEVFQGVWGLAGSLLGEGELGDLAARLGIA